MWLLLFSPSIFSLSTAHDTVGTVSCGHWIVPGFCQTQHCRAQQLQKFNFCLIRIFTSLGFFFSCFFPFKPRGAHAQEKKKEQTMQTPLSTALCDMTMRPAEAKCQRGNLDSNLSGALIFLHKPQRLIPSLRLHILFIETCFLHYFWASVNFTTQAHIITCALACYRAVSDMFVICGYTDASQHPVAVHTVVIQSCSFTTKYCQCKWIN